MTRTAPISRRSIPPTGAAEARCAGDLARAAMAVGRLDECVAAMGQGAAARLALREVEAMLWAAGTPLAAEEIGRDLADARAGADLGAMRAARWALRRLEGQGALDDLRGFLGLHRTDAPGLDDRLAPRPQGADFDAATAGFAEAMRGMAGAHPLRRGAFARLAWRLSDLSQDGDVIEAAVWSGRAMAADCAALAFVPMGATGRRLWPGGAGPDRLQAHLRAVATGADLIRLRDWAGRAMAATAKIKGDSAARIIAALTAHPVALTADVAAAAGVSRDSAERLLARMAGMGLVREVTGARRFRLWAAGV